MCGEDSQKTFLPGDIPLERPLLGDEIFSLIGETSKK